jgi:hypothetical protein
MGIYSYSGSKIRRMREKCVAIPTHGESTHQQKKVLYEHRPFEALFPNYGLVTIKQNGHRVHLTLQRSQWHI